MSPWSERAFRVTVSGPTEYMVFRCSPPCLSPRLPKAAYRRPPVARSLGSGSRHPLFIGSVICLSLILLRTVTFQSFASVGSHAAHQGSRGRGHLRVSMPPCDCALRALPGKSDRSKWCFASSGGTQNAAREPKVLSRDDGYGKKPLGCGPQAEMWLYRREEAG